ncbi:MAG: hypothetical protein FJX80_11745 [Bacteroidetes bacterium]|nr:hypothetical protein [Bacteroidota bacterium]
MKNLLIVILSGFLMTLLGCSSELNNTKSDLMKGNLKGDVVLTVTTYSYDGGKTSFALFNENGMYIKDIIGLANSSGLMWEYSYENNKIIWSIFSANFSGELVQSKTTYSYDSNGRLSESNSGGSSTQYIYNEDGQLIKSSEEGNLVKITEEFYYSKNVLDSQVRVVITKKDGSTYFEKRIYLNEKVATFIFGRFGSNEFPNSNGITFYKYNDKGDCIEEKSDEYENEKMSKSTLNRYEYSYDENGNWLQKTRFENGTLSTVLTRVIVYRGEETSPYVNEMDKITAQILNNSNKQNNSSRDLDYSGQSNQGSSSNSNQQNVRPICRGCKGSGDCMSCSKTFQVHYWDERVNGWKNRNESRKGYTMCSDCQGSGVKYKRGDYGGWVVDRKCHVSTCNDGWTFCNECNSYGSGRDIGKCKKCRGTGAEH